MVWQFGDASLNYTYGCTSVKKVWIAQLSIGCTVTKILEEPLPIWQLEGEGLIPQQLFHTWSCRCSMQSIRSRFCMVESEKKVFQVIMPPHGRLWFYSCIGLYITLLKHVFLPYSKLNFWPLDIHVSSLREAFKCFQNHWSAVVWCVLYVVFGLLRGVYVCMVHVHGVCGCVVWCGVVWFGVVWCGAVWCGVVWRGVAWRGVAWRGVAWRGVAWRGVAWRGVAWRGVAWCGVVWCGVVWCCVVLCVCTVLGHERRGSLPNTCCRNFTRQVTCQFSAGGSGPLKSPLPTKLLLSWEDIQADHLDVPAKTTPVWQIRKTAPVREIRRPRCHNSFQGLHAACCRHVACIQCLCCGHVACIQYLCCGHVTRIQYLS